MAAHRGKGLFLHHAPHRDERVRVTTWGCVVVWLLELDVVLSCVAELLVLGAADVVPLWPAELLLVEADVPLVLEVAALPLWAVVSLLSATWATAGALVAVVVPAVAACCEPNATQPPSVPTIAAVAIADLILDDNPCRRDVSLLAMILSPALYDAHTAVAVVPGFCLRPQVLLLFLCSVFTRSAKN
jgi:hypothetical protein